MNLTARWIAYLRMASKFFSHHTLVMHIITYTLILSLPKNAATREHCNFFKLLMVLMATWTPVISLLWSFKTPENTLPNAPV